MSGATTWTVGANNRLVSDGTYEYHYDKEGNRTERVTLVSGAPTGVTTLYEFDHRNRLTVVKEKATYATSTIGKRTDYVYDAYDRLVQRSFDQDGDGATYAAVDEFFAYDVSSILWFRRPSN